jgi:hypothetical protein
MVEATRKDIYIKNSARTRFEKGYAYAKEHKMIIPPELEEIYEEILRRDFRNTQ